MPTYGDVNFCPLLNTTGIRTGLIATNAVSSAKINNYAVTATKMATNAIATAKLADYGVTATKVGTAAVSTDKLAAGAVSTVKLAAGAVSTVKLAAGAVSTVKLAAGAVSTAKLAADAVSNAKVKDATLDLGDANSGSTVGKLDAKYVSFSTASSNTTVTVAHGLSRAPVGWIEVWRDNPNVLAAATSVFSATNMYFQTDQQSVAFTIMVW